MEVGSQAFMQVVAIKRHLLRVGVDRTMVRPLLSGKTSVGGALVTGG